MGKNTISPIKKKQKQKSNGKKQNQKQITMTMLNNENPRLQVSQPRVRNRTKYVSLETYEIPEKEN